MPSSSTDNDLWRWVLLQQLESYRRAGLETLLKTPPEVAAALDAFAADHPAIEVDAVQPVVADNQRPSRFSERPLQPPPERAATSSSPNASDSRLNSTHSQDSDVAKRASKSTGESPRPTSRVLNLGSDVPKTDAKRREALDVVKCEVEKCTLCPVLARGRTQTVFGVGNVRPRIAFFGEAPGADEDRQGEPFVGKAGQLLTKIIEACSFRREDVYILNVLKCRPPDNRVPSDEETENCRPFFERQLEILQPEYIVCVGATPMRALLKTNVAVGKMRQKFHEWNNSKVVVTYHPAYLLRNPDAKKYVWDDMKMMLADMGIELPKK
jgi:uracil-DNA glycosylase family 4